MSSGALSRMKIIVGYRFTRYVAMIRVLKSNIPWYVKEPTANGILFHEIILAIACRVMNISTFAGN